MKYFYTACLFLAIGFAYAQIDGKEAGDVLLEQKVERPVSMTFWGDTLFFAEYNANQVCALVVDGKPPYEKKVLDIEVEGPIKIWNKNNVLFVAEYLGDKMEMILYQGGGVKRVFNDHELSFSQAIKSPTGIVMNTGLFVTNFLDGQIRKYKTITDTEYEIVVDELSYPKGFAIDEEYIYFTEYFKGDEEKDRILRMDVTDLEREPEVVLEGLNRPNGLTFLNGFLYFTDIYEGVVYRFDVEEAGAPEPIVSNLDMPADLAIKGNDIYVCENGNTDNILCIPQAILSDPWQAEKEGQEENVLIPLQVFPNPVFDLLGVQHADGASDYAIYDMTGQLIHEGTLPGNTTIDVSILPLGVYFLAMQGKGSVKFVKEN